MPTPPASLLAAPEPLAAAAPDPPGSVDPPPPTDVSSLTLRPIGVVRSPFHDKVSAPRQPAAARDVTATIELFPRPGMEHAVEDLDGCTHLWIVFWFHEAHDFRPKVLPPRSPDKRRGVLATRSPHRPNPIGLSLVRLDRVDGLTLHIRDVDMLDGTPVLDVKPYVPYTDSVPEARVAWLQPLVADEGGASGPPPGADPERGFEVTFDPAAEQVLSFLRSTFDIDLAPQITGVLSLGPQPHPYRRIRKIAGGMQLAVKDWRAGFVAEGRHIRVTAIETGYRPSQLAAVAMKDAAAVPREDLRRDGVTGEEVGEGVGRENARGGGRRGARGAKGATPDEAALAPHRAVWERFGKRASPDNHSAAPSVDASGAAPEREKKK